MAEQARELFLIDGNSLVYRAYFALPEDLSTSDGRPSGAVFGFASMLVKVFTDHAPRRVVCVWDAGTSGRKEIYPEYKGNRPDRPDLLGEQWPAFEPLAAAFGYESVSVDGYEADDVIASLAERAKNDGYKVTILTGDRDSFQLVDENVTIMATARGITETKLYDPAAVVERYGIGPELVTDFIGLKGDTSDNIPGVPGIGEKTAAELLQNFGSIEGVLAHIDEVKGPKRREKLTEHADDARVSKQLATMHRDLEVPISLDGVPNEPPDREALHEIFGSYELREPLKRLEKALGDEGSPLPERKSAEPARELVTPLDGTVGDLQSFGDAKQPLAVALDLAAPAEGELFADERPARFGAATSGGNVLVGPLEAPAQIAANSGERGIVAHDTKMLDEIPANLAGDTLLAAYLLRPERRGYPLDELFEERGIEPQSEDAAASNALGIQTLFETQTEELERDGLTALLADVELPLVPVLRSMEQIGLKLDTERLAEISARVEANAAELADEIHELAGEEFTIGSPQQLAEILFVKLGLSRKRRGKTGFSTDARVLQSIRGEHPIVEKVERWREATKLVSTYLQQLPDLIDPADGRIHTTFNQVTAATGRLSSINPNLQNIPIRTEVGREIRACFVAEPGNVLTSADYSQVELRVLAQLSGDPVLIGIFERGEDVHTATAAEVFELDPKTLDSSMRSKAKMVNYGIVYGISAFGLADRADIPQEEAREFIDRYFARFVGVKEYIDKVIAQATEDGEVRTMLGRRRRIPELKSARHQQRQLGERLAINTVVQGSAADIIKLAMLRASEALEREKLETKLILQIHDELLFEGPEAEAEAVRELAKVEMANAYELTPPLVVDCGSGPNWLEAK